MGLLDGRRVLVTGASQGLGLAISRRAMAAGARVAMLARPTPRLDAATAELGALAVPADLREPEAAAAAVQRACSDLGGLDALVNNAGVFPLGHVRDGDISDWQAMVDINIVGLLAVTQAALPALLDGEFRQVVNMSSMSGRRVPQSTSGVYAGTKHAVHAISEALRRELHDDRLRVTVIAPGLVRTNEGEGIRDPELRATMARRQHEAGLDADDVAAQVVHVLAAPPDVHIVEIALTSTRQQPA
ncbi:SDR family oxidoreductase [Spirillospora sp. NPDC048911]|uniref:SDR family oxidoreductase n=1 Tax=Spirillospora sp. NPDC048911 TaxID=3364527 RepID=UPI003723CC2A